MNPLIPMFVRDEQDETYDLQEEIKQLAQIVGWQNLLKEVFGILSHVERKTFWNRSAAVIYWAVSDGIPLPVTLDQCAARLYYCLELFPGFGGVGIEDGENLVWSIVSRLKGVSYNSSWNPLAEPKINELLELLRSGG